MRNADEFTKIQLSKNPIFTSCDDAKEDYVKKRVDVKGPIG
jgi:hypothetical protein